ncbi:hypothetical protein AVEN_264304-1 [Araneus ventricosus]|uniref:Uncharacterized protein n=1 Tax=Araneus ventricosus TaxID=182803 RepID=A0A4Y2E0Y9_ARAVE|nr:hypothetical protein AVEN_264304-1 [Araneus ventricosus]
MDPYQPSHPGLGGEIKMTNGSSFTGAFGSILPLAYSPISPLDKTALVFRIIALRTHTTGLEKESSSQRLSGLSPRCVHLHWTSYSSFSIADSSKLKVLSSRFSDLDPLKAVRAVVPSTLARRILFLFSISSRPSDAKRESVVSTESLKSSLLAEPVTLEGGFYVVITC